MPKCSTPDGEETEVQITSHGPPPRARSGSRSHSRATSWSQTSPRPDLERECERNARADTPEEPAAAAGGGIVSKVMAMFRTGNTDDGAALQTSSMIVSVKTLTEEHIDTVIDPLDPDLRRWRNLKRTSAVGQEDLETGL